MMKIQCNMCESAEATLFCCADDAALCRSCDEKIHAANRLAGMHLRVTLSNLDNQRPKCDICQEPDGFFFCLEDRALLCRKCDAAIHTANALVSSHQRFLITGVKIGIETETNDDLSASPSAKSFPCEKVSKAPEFQFSGGSSAEQWHFDEFFGVNDLNKNYDYIDDNSSKADSSKMGDSDCSLTLRALEVELDSEDCLGQVPDSSRVVPRISSPPTASGLCWPKHYHPGCRRRPRQHHGQIDTTTFVPDVCYSNMPNLDHSQQPLKMRKYL